MRPKFYLLMLLVAACMALYSSPALAQSESHNFITYDTTISIFTPPWGPTNTWLVRISRPANMFTAGNADTASRPAIITMPGEGQQGNSDTANLTVYGPHYWLKNGWNGSVVLGNGTHYPILITICYVNEVYTNVPDVYNVVDTLLTHYHIKRDAVHFAGLSEGAFTWGSLVAYETTPGAQTGMKIMTSLAAFEGTPNPSLTEPNNTLGADTPLYKIWAAKYKGKYFYLEGSGSDNFRNGWQYSTAMNDSVPGSAYFSYESDGGGAHCCWNDMYNPSVTNWTSVGTLGTYNAPSETGTNTMGDYKAPSSIFQWMLRQGDTTLVGTGTTTPVPPTVSAGATQSITLPVSTVTLTGTAVANAGATISSTLWTQTSGPNTATIASPSALSTSVTGLVAGTYTFQLKAKDNNNDSTESVDTVHVLAIAPAVTMGAAQTIVLPQDSTTLTATDGTNGGSAITSTLWTEVSGPNTATIVTPTALTTAIKNMVAGTYSFKLTVTNSAGLTASASVGITVNPAPTPVPPTVSAGATQSITLPVSTVTLTGTAVANAGATISSTLWTQTSGPNTATIASPSALSTSVTGLVAGTYTFQLKAKDNNNDSTESVDTVHVLAIAPAVTMGAAQTIVLPQDSTTLTATDGTNGGSAITSTLWTEVSGPNTATIVTPTALTTAIKNMVAGTYSFKLTVTNTAGLTASASVGITVDPAPTGYTPTDNTSIPGTITASNYINSLSVETQPTTDVGGGLNVGWITPGDWMEYNVNVATAATYTVGFRLATPNTGCALQLRTLSGTVLATLTIPSTGGWETWQTFTTTATLPAGNQTLVVLNTGTAMWNINWMNFEYTASTTAQQPTSTADLSTAGLGILADSASLSGINLYPNPASNNVTLTVNNSHTGNMVVQVIDISGSIKKTYGLSKDGQVADLSLYIGDLPSGVYFVRMQIGNWKTIQKLLKL